MCFLIVGQKDFLKALHLHLISIETNERFEQLMFKIKNNKHYSSNILTFLIHEPNNFLLKRTNDGSYIQNLKLLHYFYNPWKT